MSNPYRAPTSEVSFTSAMPSAYLQVTSLPDGGARFMEVHAQHQRVDFVQSQLQELDMELRGTFFIPKEWCVDSGVLSAKSEVMARTPGGQIALRTRSRFGFAAGSAFFTEVEQVAGPFARERFVEKVENTIFADASPSWTLGRLRDAYPRVGSAIDSPVTAAEAAAAVERCGLRIEDLPEHARRPFPLVPAEGAKSVSVNMHSGNGLPVMGRMSTPGAAEKVVALASMVQRELGLLPGVESVADWKRKAEAERPWLVTLLGKCKADYYSREKIGAAKLRFYNVMPRQIMMVMQTATQVLEENSRGILKGFKSFSGVNLTRGGADDLVEKLDLVLAEEGHAYVHMGDDSWVVVKQGEALVAFALDCSNFDITQHADATRQVHLALKRQLASVEPRAAQLWYEYARSRQVVVARTVVRQFKHAGPSGMPLQSKVNDVLMEVLITRSLAGKLDWTSEQAVNDWLHQVGRRLGFVVKVEQHQVSRATSIREMLEDRPFLFVGYYFYTSLGQVRVCADFPRMLAQMPYPGTMWIKEDMLVKEALRLGSIVLSAGVPVRELKSAYEALKGHVVGLLERALTVVGDVEVDGLRWMIGERAWGPEAVPSVRGLIKALESSEELWLRKEVELPGTSRLLFASDWADVVDEEERSERAALGLPEPPVGGPVPRPAVVPRRAVATHPVTPRNDGRPPPTAVWGPNKEPRQRFEYAGRGTRRRGHRRAVEEVFDTSEDSEEWSD